MPLYKRKNIDWYRHLAFACVGGFFGAYAIMSRGGVMGSAQTVNLLELVIGALTYWSIWARFCCMRRLPC